MTLIEQIRTKQLAARKARIAEASLYTTLLGEAVMIGKNDGNRETTDAETIAIVKKFINNIDFTLAHLENSITDALTNDRELLIAERNALMEFLPTQLTTEQLTDVLSQIKIEVSAGPKDMGKMLAALKSRYDGQYDGKTAASVAKQLLS